MNDIEQLEQQAIDAAMNLQWKQAIELNNQIIKLDPENDSVYLRLGFIYLQMKEVAKSKRFYSKALRIQPKNSVALQNLERIRVLEKAKSSRDKSEQIAFDPDLFIESIGKTKTVALANLGQKNILASLAIGQPVTLKIKKRRVEVRTTSNDYIGTLPDDLSKRLIDFLKAKSVYVTFVKESSLTKVVVFIKEEKKGRSVAHQVSFLQNIQRKIEEGPASTEDKEETAETEEQEEHLETWEKMANENPQSEDKDLLIEIHPDDLDEDEE